MIDKDTLPKLAEIIRDTWPNLYRPPKDWKSPSDKNKDPGLKNK